MTPADAIATAALAAEVDYTPVPGGAHVEACAPRYRDGCRDDAHHLAAELITMGWWVAIERAPQVPRTAAALAAYDAAWGRAEAADNEGAGEALAEVERCHEALCNAVREEASGLIEPERVENWLACGRGMEWARRLLTLPDVVLVKDPREAPPADDPQRMTVADWPEPARDARVA